MMGVDEQPRFEDGKLTPLEAWGLKVMSIGFIVDEGAPMIWRGPMASSAVRQMIKDVRWGTEAAPLDVLVVDLPPGTGDIQLTLVQRLAVDGVVIVSTPQEIALIDARRAGAMFAKMNPPVPILGVIENMAFFPDPATGAPIPIFGRGRRAGRGGAAGRAVPGRNPHRHRPAPGRRRGPPARRYRADGRDRPNSSQTLLAALWASFLSPPRTPRGENRLMNRRQLFGTAVAASAAAWLPRKGFAGRSPMRRVRPGDAAWPALADWDALKAKVGGRLVQPRALLADCAGDPNSAACKADLANLANPFWIGDQPAGTEVSGWLGAWTPAPSAYVVAAESAADIVAAVEFASRHNLRLVVKGTGHSYQGTSNAPDFLMIWTRAMNSIALHDAFVPQGCGADHPPSPAVTLGAGAMWIDAYDAVTTKAGRYVQGGGCATVGVAGLVQSGGFGSFSKFYGTASSWLLEAEIVTADGVLRTVNACKDPELFWALKGGGGGSWGAIVSLTLATHALPQFLGGAQGTIKAASDAAFQRLIDRFLEFYAGALMNPHWGESVHFHPDNRLEISMVLADLKYSEANAVWKPFFDWVSAAGVDYTWTGEPDVGVTLAQGWWDAAARLRRGSTSMIPDRRPGAPPHHAWWSGDQGQVGAFLYAYDFLWLGADLLEAGRRESLADALFAASRHAEVELHINKGLAGAPQKAREAALATAMNPQVTGAFALAIIATGGPSQYPGLPFPSPGVGMERAKAADIGAAAAALRVVAPQAGSYLSESNFFNADWKRDYWGDNHARLAEVKAKFDPTGLFFVHHGVGCEAWSADGFTRVA